MGLESLLSTLALRKNNEEILTTTIPITSRDYENTHIVERPDGFYWYYENDSDKVFGPFPTLLEATQDMEYNADSDFEPGETLEQAEDEIGVSSWIDHETGEPGEDSPHLED